MHRLQKLYNYSYGHNCAVCQILFNCWAHSQTHFLLLLTAWQPQVDCAPLAPLDRTCGGTSAAGGLRSTRCSGDPGFTRLLSLSWNMQRLTEIETVGVNVICFLQNVKTKHECTRFTRLSHPGTSLSPFASINVPPIIPASSSDRWVGSDVPLSPFVAQILCQCKATCSLTPCFESEHFFFTSMTLQSFEALVMHNNIFRFDLANKSFYLTLSEISSLTVCLNVCHSRLHAVGLN